MGFTVPIVPDVEDGGYLARVPSIPNCFTHGESPEHAAEMAQDAAAALLASMAAHREELPIEAAGATAVTIDIAVPVPAGAPV